MLNIPEEVKTLFKADSVFKNFRVHFPNGENADLTNDDIVSESVSFTESICSAQVFQFGLSERSEIEFECVGVQNIYGMTIECAIEICVDSLGATWISDHAPTGNEAFLDLQVCTYDGRNMYRVPYGRFIVESCPRSQGAMKHRRVTAYSLLDQYADADAFVQDVVLPVDTIHTSYAALTSYITGDVSRYETQTKSRDTYMDLVHLFDSSGYAYEIFPMHGSDDGTGGYRDISGRGYRLLIENTSNTTYEQVGIETAQYLDDNGYDLTYNPDGVKVFDTNEEALRALFGYLFRPTFYAELAGVGNTAAVYQPYPARTGKFVPLFFEASSGLKLYFTENATSVVIRKSSTPNIWASSNTWSIVGTATLSEPYTSTYEFEIYYDAYDRNDVEIKSTGELTDAFHHAGKASSSSNKEKWFTGTMYTFIKAYQNRDVISGAAEIQGRFGRTTRSGDFEFLQITNASPVAMSPADYSELWWDEYTVEPVGKVKYSYKDPATSTETIAEVTAGTGSSEYDMLNNYILENLNISDEDLQWLDYASVADYVATLIREKFVPNVGVVSFTPVTLDAIGLPYIEAGDYLEIDDADGGTVGTYVLSRTLSGIQVLTDSIESKGGEVLGNGS
jgi:hypothetical protein